MLPPGAVRRVRDRWRAETPAGSLVVEAARESDAEALAALHREVLAEGRTFVTELEEHRDSPALKAEWLRALHREVHCKVLVARREGRVLGYLVAEGGGRRRTRHVARLELFVWAEARGLGVGSALMQACLDWAEESPVLRKLSLAVLAHNTRAIRLYERFGFVVEGRRVGEYRLADGTEWDDLLMARAV